MKRVLALVFAVALAARLVAAARVTIIDRDGVWYLAAAGLFARGDFRAGLAFHYPPAFPLLAALALRLRLAPETAGLAVSALAGALGAVFAAGLARRSGNRAAWVAGLTFALHPASVEMGCAVTADALFATLLLGALLAAERGRFAASGALAALGYLARPEGIVAVLLLALKARRKFWRVLLAALVLVLPYMAVIKSEPMMGREHGAGEWKLSRKREVLQETGLSGTTSLRAAAALAGQVAERFVKQLYYVLHAGKELAAVLLLLAAIQRRGPWMMRGAPGRPELGLPLALLATYALFRVDARYGAIVCALLVPWLGAWLAALARPKWLLALALLVPLIPATRLRHTKKTTWREAGLVCRGFEKIAATDPRVAFYGGAPVFFDLNAMSLEEARARGAQVAVFRDGAMIVSSTRPIVIEHAEEEAVRIVPLE